jgi:hypothetical protein
MATTIKTPETIRRLGTPLDEVRAALKGVDTDLRAGGRDLYGDVETFVRSVRRDTVKLGKALHGDIERLVTAPGERTPPPLRHRATPAARRRTAAAHPKKKTPA